VSCRPLDDIRRPTKEQAAVRRKYEVRSGRRAVSVQNAETAQEAIIEYLYSIGCRRDELIRLGANSVAWRGSVYKASPVEPEGSRATPLVPAVATA
jgi:site-specific recombinase XerD